MSDPASLQQVASIAGILKDAGTFTIVCIFGYFGWKFWNQQQARDDERERQARERQDIKDAEERKRQDAKEAKAEQRMDGILREINANLAQNNAVVGKLAEAKLATQQLVQQVAHSSERQAESMERQAQTMERISSNMDALECVRYPSESRDNHRRKLPPPPPP